MDALFQNKDIYVTLDSIEIEGQEYSPLHLKAVRVAKHGTELKSAIWGAVWLLAGLYAAFSLKWTAVGWIAIIIGIALIALNYPAVRSGKVTTQVLMGFQTTHTGDANWKSILLNDYNQALKLQEVLKGVAGLP